MTKQLLSGNEAIARGALEAGVTVVSGYPGTPSTEILENIGKFYGDKMFAEWAPNEKVAFETAAGASTTGARSMTTMKLVGLNVAADPLMTLFRSSRGWWRRRDARGYRRQCSWQSTCARAAR